MKKFKLQISFMLSLFLVVFLFLSCGKIKEMFSDSDKNTKEDTKKEQTKETTKDDVNTKDYGSGNKLYFCEDYVQKEEVNVSDKFSTGRLTVMVKTKEQLYDRDVALKLERLNDDGSKDYLKTIDFTIPIGDYFFFKHKDLGFSKPGYYRVTLIGKNGSPVCSGEVTIE